MDASLIEVSNRFFQLLNNDPDVFAAESFLRNHDVLLRQAFGIKDAQAIRWSPHLEVMVPDVALMIGSRWTVVAFEMAQYPLFLARNKPVSSVANSVDELETLREWIRANPGAASSKLAGLDDQFEGIVFAGNRDLLDIREMEYLREFNASLKRLSIRTYNWLIDQKS